MSHGSGSACKGVDAFSDPDSPRAMNGSFPGFLPTRGLVGNYSAKAFAKQF